MSFTEDELHAFNSILEQRLAVHRQDIEQMLDLRILTLRHDLEQRLTPLVDEALADRLLAIEELLQQQLTRQAGDEANVVEEQVPPFAAIEVQTDLPWDDLLAIFGKALDERLTTLKESMRSVVQETMQAVLKDEQQHLLARLQMLATQQQAFVHLQPQSNSGTLTTIQDVFNSIEQLERIIESMQVAMTNNQALLANRLYHHQQLSHERAHQVQQPQSTQLPQPATTPDGQPNGTTSHVIQVEQE